MGRCCCLHPQAPVIGWLDPSRRRFRLIEQAKALGGIKAAPIAADLGIAEVRGGRPDVQPDLTLMEDRASTRGDAAEIDWDYDDPLPAPDDALTPAPQS